MTVEPPPAQMSGCDWPVSYASCGPCSAMEALPPEDQAAFEQMAAEFLWRWTGQMYGTCPIAVRPCRENCAQVRNSTFWGWGPLSTGSSSAWGWGPVLIGGQWFNVVCGSCHRNDCSCGVVHSLVLPGPVASVEEVLVDGAVLPATDYRVDDHDTLIRLDGEPWPVCQDIAAAITEPGTWQITYHRGTTVPWGGQVAAGMLACELAKAACSDKTCQLPQRIQSVTRQGVTVAVAVDSFDDVDKGRTGIWLIDAWVASVVAVPKRGGSVMSPDFHPGGRFRTTTIPPGG